MPLMDSLELSVCSLPSQSYAYTNCIYAELDDFMYLIRQTPKSLATKDQLKTYGLNVIINNKYIFALKPLKEITKGQLGMGSMQRQTANLAMNQNCQLQVYVPTNLQENVLKSVSIELQIATRNQMGELRLVDCKELATVLIEQYQYQYLMVGQLFVMDFNSLPLRIKITKLELLETDVDKNGGNIFEVVKGQLLKGTNCLFTKVKETPLKLVNQMSNGTNSIFKSDFDFSKLGIGGLDKEFNDIFRRAFSSRIFPASVIEQMGINHVRGMLLYGPPGCGKTLIARQIGKVLNAKEPKVVNGPEILDKFVGESERKVRELFADARKDMEELGDQSELHIIIFDEIDAICKARGSSRDGTGVGDSVVNQLLTQIDGVDSLNNVLVIGMTNRKDMLDDALLRPGRLEVQIEINLPNEKGRADILRIHTAKAREHGFLDKALEKDLDSCFHGNSSSDTPNLAQRTKNFSGAEIEGLVRAATSHALAQGTDGKTFHAVQNFRPIITLEHFDLALEEIIPKFGMPKEGLEHLYRYGITTYSSEFKRVQSTMEMLIQQIKTNEKTNLISVLLHGSAGTGKTALAAYTATMSEVPFIRLITAQDYIGMMETGKCSKIYSIFQEAYRSPLSFIILDDIEQLMEYVAIGPRFSNQVLQAIKVLIKTPPPVLTRKLFIIGTTSLYEHLEELNLTSAFDVSLQLEEINTERSLRTVLEESEVPKEEINAIVQKFTQSISIKKLLMLMEISRQKNEKITCEEFMDCVEKLRIS